MRRPNWSVGKVGTVLWGGEEAFKWLDICVGDHYSEVACIKLYPHLSLFAPTLASKTSCDG